MQVAAKKLARRLEALGARPLIGMGLGDDQHPSGYEAALDTWCAALWPLLRAEAGPLPEGIQQVRTPVLVHFMAVIKAKHTCRATHFVRGRFLRALCCTVLACAKWDTLGQRPH